MPVIGIRSGRDRGRSGSRGQAGRAEAEQLEAVVVDPIAGLPRDLAHDRSQAQVGDLGRAPTRGAHDVVVMRRLAADVGVLARWQVEPLDSAELREDLERPEDGRAPDAEVTAARVAHQLRGREVARLLGDQHGQRAAWLGQPVAGAVEGGDDRGASAMA